MGMTIATARRMRVSELASAAGVSPDTVQYYERVGLLHPPERTPAGYRAYDATAIDRLRFIQGAQRLGLRLREIRDLLTVRDTGACPCEPADRLLRNRLAEIDAQMARLTALRAELVAMVDALPSADCPDPLPGTWCPPDRKGRRAPSPVRRTRLTGQRPEGRAHTDRLQSPRAAHRHQGTKAIGSYRAYLHALILRLTQDP